MYRTLNLYALSRLKNDRMLSDYVCIMSGKRPNIKLHEYKTLRGFTDLLYTNVGGIRELDGYNLSYVIPRIGKEFDLLRISQNAVLNVELKAVNVGETEIKEQLERNIYYLRHLGKALHLFTYVLDENKLYTLGSNGELREANISELTVAVTDTNDFYTYSPDTLFDPEDYIFSPTADPQRFLEHRYFLTQHQEYIEKRLLENFEKEKSPSFVCISGGNGSGKTLLIYDLAVKLAKFGSVCIISTTRNMDGINKFSAVVSELSVFSKEKLNDRDTLSKFKYIFIDDAHMLSKEKYISILEQARTNSQKCIFAIDSIQRMSYVKRTKELVDNIRSIEGLKLFELTDKINIDPEISAFINSFLDRNISLDINYNYENVQLFWTYTIDEAELISEYYQKQGYCRDTSYTRKGALVLLDDKYYYDTNNIICCDDDKIGNDTIDDLVFNKLKNCGNALVIIVFKNLKLFKQISQTLIKARERSNGNKKSAYPYGK